MRARSTFSISRLLTSLFAAVGVSVVTFISWSRANSGAPVDLARARRQGDWLRARRHLAWPLAEVQQVTVREPALVQARALVQALLAQVLPALLRVWEQVLPVQVPRLARQ